MTSDVTFDELSALAAEVLPERTVLSGVGGPGDLDLSSLDLSSLGLGSAEGATSGSALGGLSGLGLGGGQG